MSWDYVGQSCYEEKMLWIGVLRRAIFDYVLYKGKAKHELRWKRAYRYLFGNGTFENGNLTFSEVCGMFGWEPGYIQRVIRRLDRSDIKRLEASRFRDDFKMNTAQPTLEIGPRWGVAEAAVPIFKWLSYSRQYREPLRPRQIFRQEYSVFAPMVQWQVT